MSFSLMLAALVGILSVTAVKSETTIPILEHQWETGFKMNIRLQLLDNVTRGWNMTLRFTKPAPGLQIWRAKIVSVSDDNKVYELMNMPCNPDLEKCSILNMAFLADKSKYGKPAPEASVEFRRKSASNSQLNADACSPTTSPTTRSILRTETTIPILEHEWETGFKMNIRLQLLENVTGGWNMTLRFTKPAPGLQIWRAKIVSVSDGNKVYELMNMPWNPDLEKCSILNMAFLADKSKYGKPAPEAFVEFKRKSASNLQLNADACSSTTSPTTTKFPPTMTSSSTATSLAPPQTTTKLVTANPSTSSSSQPTTHQTSPPTTVQKETTTANTDAPTTSPSPYDYNKVLHASILFYEAQRSGKLPATNRIPWRGDSALSDRGDNGEDLTGGWYDAGDFVKFGFPMASSATVLAWGLVEYRDAYKAAGELDAALDSIKWATDYFIKAHTAKFEFYGQVGDGDVDHAYWGRPEDMTMRRPGFKITTSKPGSELAAETAAALAAASIAFAQTKQSYASKLVKHAEELYEFADKYRGKYSDSIPNAASFYKSYSGFNDELVWGAAWLYKATKKQAYLHKAEQYYTQYGMNSKPWAFSWDDKKAGAQVLLAEITGKASYKKDVQTYLDSWLPGGDIHYTPKGLAWRAKWGPNRYSANTAFLALVAAKSGLKQQTYRDFARKQIHYMLGDSGRSFVVGFGANPPLRPHHASSSCPSKPAACTWNDFKNPAPNPQTLTGALVGGPDKNDHYEDKRSDYIQNEVTTDYNAGFQSAVAGLKDLEIVA